MQYKMEANEILKQTNISYFTRVTYSRTSKEINLYDWMNNYSYYYRDTIKYLRTLDNEQSKEYKKDNLPCVTISATFNTYRRIHDLKERNSVIAIDIDGSENNEITDWTNVKIDALRNIKGAFLASLSCRGNGVFILIHYNKDNDFLQTWNSLKEDFKELGYIIDENCKDITRTRFISLDTACMIKNGDIDMYDKVLDESESYYDSMDSYSYSSNHIITEKNLKDIAVSIFILVNFLGYKANEYMNWLKEGMRLATIPDKELGFKLFLMISEHSDSYKGVEDAKNKFSNCIATTRYDSSILGYYINKIKEILGTDWKYRVNDILNKNNIRHTI